MIARKTDLRDVVGSTHMAGLYNFTEKDYLNEGADALLEMGTRVIKLWLSPATPKGYPFNSEWPPFDSLTELAQTPYLRSVFSKPFTTYILEAFSPGAENVHYFTNGMTDDDKAREDRNFYDLTKHFLTEYKDTGKTFVLQNWESDWVLTQPGVFNEPTATAVQGMIDWFNTRQDAVERARREVGMDGVTVVHAAEVNLIVRAMEGKTTATNNVVPQTHCDLYSYSSWDTSLAQPERFREALDYLAGKAPASELYGKKNVFAGEFGVPENEFGGPEGQLRLARQATEVALDWGAHYVVYWELFCNERAHDFEGRPTNSDCRGFWLIRPDGTKSPVWDYFAGLYE